MIFKVWMESRIALVFWALWQNRVLPLGAIGSNGQFLVSGGNFPLGRHLPILDHL